MSLLLTRRMFLAGASQTAILTVLPNTPAYAQTEGEEETDTGEQGDEQGEDGETDATHGGAFERDWGWTDRERSVSDSTPEFGYRLSDGTLNFGEDRDQRESRYSLGDFDFSRASGDPDTHLSEGIPATVDREESIFERVSAAHQRVFGDTVRQDSRNDGAAQRLADTATHVSEAERAAKNNDKGFIGKWGRDTERGHLQKGEYKCNMAFGEWSEKAGLSPIYRDGKTYADTKHILAKSDSLKCWRVTDTPQRGDALVMSQRSGATHIGVVTDPTQGKAVSAGTKITSEYRHWAPDKSGVARPIWNSASEARDPKFAERPEVKFFEYHCPDQKVLETFPYD